MYGYYTQRHKVFISFYHKDDQAYKEYIDKYLSGNIINKSVVDGEYSTDNSDEYIKRLIREDKISDSCESPDGGYYYADMPARLADNIKSGYADFYDWDYAISHFDTIIEKAFYNRVLRRNLINNSRLQMQRNLGV